MFLIKRELTGKGYSETYKKLQYGERPFAEYTSTMTEGPLWNNKILDVNLKDLLKEDLND